MIEKDSQESPLVGAAGLASSHATDAFALLANETRLAILLALWEAYDPHDDHDAVSFSELRDRVGVRQGAQFNYHLDKLVGRFVRKGEAGYELRPAGLVLVQNIIAGTGIDEPTLEATEVDDTCELCGAPTAITYENNRVYQLCTECDGGAPPGDEHPNGMLKAWSFEPTGLSGRTAEEVFAASTIKTFGRIAMRFEGICPDCSAPIDWSVDVCPDHVVPEDGPCDRCGRHRAILARETCTVCKSSGWGSPGIKVLFHPAIVSFFHERGLDVGFTGSTGFADVVELLNLVEEFEETVVSVDPLRIRVSAARDGDEIHVLLDGEMDVVEVHEPA